jgi:glycosyltransferase involved in cell wall biosynthesis
MLHRVEINSSPKYTGRVGLQQRILPSYRAPFFDALAGSCLGGLQVFGGQPLENEGVTPTSDLKRAQVYLTRNRHFLNPLSPFYLCWQDNFLRWLKSWQPDVVIMEANPRYLSTYRALRYVHKTKKPVLGWGLGAPRLNGVVGLILNWERRLFLMTFDALIAYSHKGAREFLELGIPSERIFVASNAVAPRPSEAPVIRPREINSPPIVLYVGRLQIRKRVDLLIRACVELPQALQPRLQIVGDGPARLELETLARAIYPKTEFLGSVHGSNLAPIFAGADLFVLPGTGGLAVQEAMAYGLPVIVAHGDGTQEDLVRPENGWQISPDDAHALQLALHEGLSNPEKLRQMGYESFRIARHEINIETMVSVFLDALSSVS